MPQRIAFLIGCFLWVASAALFWHYQHIRSNHIVAEAAVVNMDAQFVRPHANVSRRFFHLVIAVPTSDGKQHTFMLKDGSSKRPGHRAGDTVAVLYPDGALEEARLLRATDELWPSVLAFLLGAFAFFTAFLFHREAAAQTADSASDQSSGA